METEMDYRWCYANPTKAAAEIARLRVFAAEIEGLHKIILMNQAALGQEEVR